jgi:hypothetical protein
VGRMRLIANRLLMKRRREHGECDTREGGRGCLVFGTGACTFRRNEVGWVEKMKRGLSRLGSQNALMLWVCVALVGGLLAWVGMEMPSHFSS